MTDEQIYELAFKHCYATTGANGFIFDRKRGHMIAFARALLDAAKVSDGAQNFACYLIDKCEGEEIKEERIQRWLGKMLDDPQYAAPPALIPMDDAMFSAIHLPIKEHEVAQ